MAIANTGTSSHYFMPSAPIINVNRSAPPISIRTTTKQCQHFFVTAAINLPTLPANKFHLSHIMPTFTNNLLSIGTLCDADCTAIFTRFWVTIHDRDGITILQSPQEEQGSQLCRINLHAHNKPVCPPGHKYCRHASTTVWHSHCFCYNGSATSPNTYTYTHTHNTPYLVTGPYHTNSHAQPTTRLCRGRWDILQNH